MRSTRAMRPARQTRTRGATTPALSPRQLVALVLLFVLTSLSFVVLDRRALLDPLKGPVEGPLRAAAEGFTRAGQRVGDAGDRFGNVEELRAENERLRADNERLRASDARLQALERENEQLIKQANFATKFPQYQLVPARIIGRDPASREQYLLINRGAEHGLQIGMPAVSPDFLVGVVTEVYPNRAKVRLIIDERMQLGVQLQEEPRTPGILYGKWQEGGRLTMEYVDRDATIKPKTPIVTSGLTGRVPGNLLIGYVADVKKDLQKDSQEITVVPYVNFDDLESVTIVLATE